MKKFDYYLTMQGNYGYGWDDEISEPCDSTGRIKDDSARALFRENVKLYRANGGGIYRIIQRRELNV